MEEMKFFRRAVAPTLAEIVEWTGAKPAGEVDLNVKIFDVAPLDRARPGDLVFLDNPKYADQLAQTRATACLVSERYADRAPAGVAALVVREPYRACAMVTARIYPEAARPGSWFDSHGVSPGANVHPLARLEPGVIVDPGAVVGPHAEIGADAVIGPNSVIGPHVRVGRGSTVGAGATVANALIGDRVIIHPGVRIGQDGFGFAMSPRGHLKAPQVGRVIIQDDVEIGANSTIDRGANRDTIIGEGAKIDNLVQIAHNVVVGRHCVIVSQVGISGSTELGDFVVAGGQAGITGHLKIGMGAQIAAQSGVMADVAPGAKMGGSPARDARLWLKGVAALDRMVRRKGRDD
ncbi:UDP-3-O-(3-hydroxymyristoyl)glucosamine N-acyltransferase [Rhodoblastus acidophilus]|uniref:UDP-3-O-acylglucosamine N-acyltransferase n=1 Tax=Candidatus Rhodoblastus alkanivorans TaxID=2954117 RepID=A0ABS9Z6A2_9HYPH|nr:UDP-3-O-(3-hydroxymyristoyl)glucosamine N-acyltransferase [Candidatus Rhodoblastus alkanivorans]MCI4680438.1 UDP-3-O-(3-hydroxymyristoyl)glucosamine N-acyltransferase [Candidatus Rhodoblastus alkanivorans]MCI4683199.1 UDP-3-O-(3-hydroxymyristoyl)glucosamine N-acyltransferase [Candidatus Rhodoblastus alkanivorans]MDI4640511.1 UDP-3-O-(3-hydroxymyristoyl)glucosamine N-acyltransferase [Rhodoblastus acidophilus]